LGLPLPGRTQKGDKHPLSEGGGALLALLLSKGSKRNAAEGSRVQASQRVQTTKALSTLDKDKKSLSLAIFSNLTNYD
jgi:hypothetical protein